MLRKKQNLLGRQSRAQDVQGKASLDNPNVVIDGMTHANFKACALRPFDGVVV
jgi:hypothetical protein